jgi:hypothetical protein
MAAKTKRMLNVQDDRDAVDEASPLKRLRTEHSPNGLNGHVAATKESVELDDVEEEESVEVVPAPVVDELYLDTVRLVWDFAHE